MVFIRQVRVALLLVAAAGMGCFGTADLLGTVDATADAGEEAPPLSSLPVPPAPAQFECDDAAVPTELPLPRLSRTQLENSLRFAIAQAQPAVAEGIWAQVEPTFARFPKDLRSPAPGDLKGGYSRMDQSIQQSQVDVMFDLGRLVARELTEPAPRLTALLGNCASDSDSGNDRSCLESFVRGWGARVLRAPLLEDEVAFFADAAGTTPVAPSAVAEVITLILNSPRFLYRVEHGTDPSRTVSPLSAFELASRLSYQFWQAPPDDALWASATTGALLTTEGFEAQLTRLLHSDRFRGALDEFVDEWLRLEELPSLVALQNEPIYRAFVGDVMPTDDTRVAMIEDVRRSAWNTLLSGGSASDFLWDRRAYTGDAFLASLYGVSPWDGSGPAPEVPSPARSGLLTRAALLATGTASTRPIHKGYLVRNALLCQQVGAPPPNASDVPPAPTETTTTREAVTRLTSTGTCAACHNGAINPPGFVLEGFDALGRERTHERLFDGEGNVTASPEVDTLATVFIYGAEKRELSTAVELTRAIDDSQLFESCVARHVFRFSQARVESLASDGCLLADLEQRSRGGAPMEELFKTVARHPTFQNRSFQ